MDFKEQVWEASVKRTTKADVESYYKREYPGEKTKNSSKGPVTTPNWQGKLATDLSNLVGVKRASVMRRYQKGRKDKLISEKHQAEYLALGATLPLMPPGRGYHIKGIIRVMYSSECVTRKIDQKITGLNAQHLLTLDEEEMLQGVASAYQAGDGDVTFKGGPLPCDAWHVTVTPIQ